ncbi:AP-3 complex subunit beta-1 isoform X2 [Hemiscyllium ocellatum]|uniref:AP-3 complex subunit beta-1 isoform X2 n=1 Tax=Hemiscyllium ocellatum TaxID=170820 RepID=UPI00296759A0|nr:AP-3 complex subunit beta-1 isoform X2 [Hemiscyllium ocellatum]
MATNSISYNDQGLGRESTELGQEATAMTSGGGAGAGFRLFSVDYKKNEDLHQMLDSNKDSLKLEAMKRIVGMIAKGKDASELFPAVVKNVASKNIELKKLVYVYLVRYAEEQQDLALLSISTFQRALKEAVNDLSPYVRKTAAHAIQKLYSLDAEQKEPLIEIIEKLLKDKSTLVAGSVVMSFEEVCPERIDLIHKNYRKLCNLLVDVEEWGQVVIINMLTRYARTQFLSPWKEEMMLDENNEKAFYDSDEDQNKNGVAAKKPYIMDPDHRLLLRNTRPLLQSRNAAVVMGVAQLYWHLAPKSEVNIVAKSLIRLLRSHREVQYVVLQNIATMTIRNKGMFEPYLKSFYIRSTDPTQIKILKLEILTNLTSETNIPIVLREFQTYVKSQDKQFAAATIQAIGRCATNISEVTDTCLNGLVYLLSNRDENVVAESVVVIKKLLQTQPSQHSEIIKHMAKLLGNITVPMARASILWLIGEYCERVPKIAPDVLRKVAKSFTTEEEIVKLQILNLGAKLCLTNPKQTKLLMQYILNVAKYDQNYDIRDRTRFIKQLIVPNEKSGALSKYAKKIFLVQKPAPVLESPFKDRDRFQLSTLSHTLNTKANGYLELPEWPESAPDPSVRNVEVIQPVKLVTPGGKSKGKKDNLDGKFYSDSEEQEDSSQSSESSSESESDSKNEDSSSSSSEESSDSESDKEEQNEESEYSNSENNKTKTKPKKLNSATSSESEDSSSEDDSESGNDSDLENTVTQKKEEKKTVSVKAAKQEISLLDLVDFSDVSTPVTLPKPVMASRLAADLEGLSLSSTAAVIDVATPVFVPPKSYPLLHRMSGKGLGAEYHFSRQQCIYNSKMVSVQIILTNNSDKEIRNIRIGERKLASGMRIHDFYEIECLEPGTSKTASMGIDFCDSTQAANFVLCTCNDQFSVTVQPPVGELLMPVTTSEKDFKKEQGKLTGMNENSTAITGSPQNSSSQAIVHKVVNMANVGVVPSGQDNIHRFAAKTVNSGSLVLITIEVKEGSTMQLRINTEKSVIGSVLLRELKSVLSQD